MSKDKAEFDVFKGLLNNSQKNTLSSEILLEAVRERCVAELGTASQVYVLHDRCDIRKPYSTDMEGLGKVMSLQKQVVDGYDTFNSFAVDVATQKVVALSHEMYSNRLDHYVSQEHLGLIENNVEKGKELLDSKGKIISTSKQEIVAGGVHINSVIIAKKHIKASSETLKKANASVDICHILDREYDNEAIFEHIDTLADTFVIRLKLNRLSNEQKVVYTKTGKVSKQIKYSKLVDKTFANQCAFSQNNVRYFGKVYDQLDYKIDFEPLIMSAKTYHVVRVGVQSKGGNIFNEPMLLITNEVITNLSQALAVYKRYLLRFKIEVVFRFLKQQLGWETFQIRDFASIANLLSLVFFLVGYFKELEEELKKHPLCAFICGLALSKGKITLYFLLEGIKKIIHYQEVAKWMEEENITPEQLKELIKQAKI